MPRMWSIQCALIAGCTAIAAGNSVSGTQAVTLNLGAISKISVVQPNVALAHSGSLFGTFTGTVTVQYKVRTTPSGSSTLTVQAASNFSPANGPSLTASDLTYTCSGATLGTGCSGSQTVSTSAATNIVTVGGGACSGSGCAGPNPNSVSLSLTLIDSPVFRTGTYSTSLTFSISAI